MSLRLLLAVAVVAAGVALVVPHSETAQAHAALLRSSPAGQARLPTPPASIDLWFSEPLEPRFSNFTLYDSSGAPIPVSDIAVDSGDSKRLSGRLPALRPGIYTVAYRTLSTLDGHEWTGSFSFVVLDANGAAPGDAAFVPDLARGSSWQNSVARWLTFAGYALLLGGATTVLLVTSPAGLDTMGRGLYRRLGVAAAPLLVAGAVLQLVDQQQALGGSLGAILGETRFGTFWLFRQLLVLAALVALGLAFIAAARQRERVEQALLVVMAALSATALGTIAMVGHAAAAPGRGWAIGATFVHLVVASAWVGGLVFLVALGFTLGMRAGRDGLTRLLPAVAQFSLIAAGAMYVLVVTGLVRSFGQLPTASALVDTTYGRWLLVKLGLIALALGVALLNRRLLRRARSVPTRQKAQLARGMRLLLSLEGSLALAVLLSVAVLGQTPPPVRSPGREAVSASFIDVQEAGDVRVHLEVTPAQTGPNELRVHVFRPDGSDVGAIQAVRVTLISGPEVQGGTVVQPAPAGAGLFVARDVVFGLVSRWEVRVDVQRGGLDDIRVAYGVPIARAVEESSSQGSFASPAPQLTENALGALALVALAVLLGLQAQRQPGGRRAFPIAVAGILLGGAWFTAGSASLTQGARSATPESIALGRALYSQNCVSCHGLSGRGDGPQAAGMKPPPADLVFHLPQHGDAGMLAVIEKGIPAYGMPGWGDRLSKEQLQALLDFLRADFDRGPQATSALSGPRP